MGLSLEECDNDMAWDAFVNRSPHGTVFALTGFLQSSAFTYHRWWVRDGRGTPLAALLMPLGKDKRPPKHLVPFSMYQGVMLASELLVTPAHRRISECMAVLNYLIEALTTRYPYFHWCLPTRFEDMRPFQWHNHHQPKAGTFSLDLRYTGCIDLRDQATINDFLAKIRPTRRWEYRRAARDGVTAELCTEIELLIELYERTFKRQGQVVATENIAHLRALANWALADGFGEIIIARTAEGVPASATLFLRDAHRAYYLIGANDPAFRSSHSGVFAFVESIRRCFDLGDQEVDVCGINSPNRGDFKISFNAKPSPYFEVDWES